MGLEEVEKAECLKSAGWREEPGPSFDIHQRAWAWKKRSGENEGGMEEVMGGKQVWRRE